MSVREYVILDANLIKLLRCTSGFQCLEIFFAGDSQVHKSIGKHCSL